MAEETVKSSGSGVPRAVLLGLSATYVVLGVAFLLAPAKMAGFVDITTATKTGLIELRAFYGGVELGLGAFLALAATRREWYVPALVAALMSFLGIAGARIYGISVEGVPGALVFLLLAFELGGVVAATWGLVQLKKGDETKADTLEDDIEALRQGSGRKPELSIPKPKPIEKTKPIIDRTIRLEK